MAHGHAEVAAVSEGPMSERPLIESRRVRLVLRQ